MGLDSPATSGTSAEVVAPATSSAPSTVESVAPETVSSPEKKASSNWLEARQNQQLNPEQARALQRQQKELSAILGTRLSLYLRSEVVLESEAPSLVKLKKWESKTTPTHLTLFRADPLPNICLIEIMPRLGLTLVDRVMGGAINPENPDRCLSEVENVFLDDVEQLILTELFRLWADFQKLKPALLGHESDIKALAGNVSENEVFVILPFIIKLGNCQGQIRICFPHAAIEPVLHKMTEKSDTSKKLPGVTPQATVATAPVQWNSQFNEIPVTLGLAYNGLKVPARTAASLKVGDLLPLDPEWFQQIVVRVDKQPRFVGHLGRCEQQWAVQLTQLRRAKS